ncbi:MAG: Fumble domain-containing protein [Gemmatimonas sp.]|uniref:Fumble domain-containing protein n=1 Tax=Gemmatimonas sp. TaxID=1962908 RepID=UPI00391FC113
MSVPLPSPLPPEAAIDFGASNTDVVVRDAGGTRHWRLPTEGQPDDARVRQVLAAGGLAPADVAWIAITGGNRSLLSPVIDDRPVHRIDEVQAIGRGGLVLSGLEAAVVTSAGSGTAVVAARPEGSTHVTGTGVGGGTLVGLSRLLLGTIDPREIDALAREGKDTAHNLTIGEILGQAIGSLPPETTAVNFGRVARHPVVASREDTAAALVNMLGQFIDVIAINAARAQHLEHAVIVGHLTDLPSIRRTLGLVAQFYGASLRIPEQGGSATALGALLVAAAAQPR